ncbi:hypothetical protein HW532_21525 [Kaustia mangrovi]|uniref:Uncharacterized protein n=1 Tax=Kaustia mangrovi TaxID=2593653 RepID=A0A7S8C7V2_9HYPH|nr:hypothetical protein [Kaustia mangrovi]QPC45048.1 hypothetical protein HW532_21525 [Kaustia mangrovi]
MKSENQECGLKLRGTDFVYFDEGAYGLIFLDRIARRVRKVFRAQDDKEHVCKVFVSETKAYERALACSSLRQFVPGNFRICEPRAVVTKYGAEVSDKVFQELVFEIDFIDGYFVKIGSICKEKATKLHELFHAEGIKYTIDMSVTLADGGRAEKVIDFGIEEIEAIYNQ